ncbi:MAG: hypothetical protein E6K23_11420 [Gammaproteobacteria bacterium]|nr:MAG: hypothetical protein E6K23_11420 [Gammaproteobacteria bacterium]
MKFNSNPPRSVIAKGLALATLFSVMAVADANPSADAVARLHAARSLRCTFTSEVTTWVRNGHRTVEQTAEHGSATYDNIDVAKGTARMVANAGAGDLTVWVERTLGSLWMLERTPSGNVVVTTVFPMHAEGTDEFVVLEARHLIMGTIVLGQDTYGTCKVWQ